MTDTTSAEGLTAERLEELRRIAEAARGSTDDWIVEYDEAFKPAVVLSLLHRIATLEAALGKIDAIRDSIVGFQTINWSEHIYPLVAALGEAGYEGAGYEISRKNAGTLLEQIKAAESSGDAMAKALEENERDAARWQALMRTPRISMQGSSGVDPHTGERNGNNVHFGAEFWPHPPSPDFIEHYRKGTEWGRACLKALADAIIEHEARQALVLQKGEGS